MAALKSRYVVAFSSANGSPDVFGCIIELSEDMGEHFHGGCMDCKIIRLLTEAYGGSDPIIFSESDDEGEYTGWLFDSYDWENAVIVRLGDSFASDMQKRKAARR